MPTSTIVGKAASAFVLSRLNETLKLRQVVDIGPGCGTYRRLLGPFLPDARWIAVEAWEPYVEAYGLKPLYDEVHVADATRFDLSRFEPGGAILFGDVVDYMPAYRATDLVTAALDRFDVAVLSIPLGDWPPPDDGGNPYEAHRTAWFSEDIARRFASSLAGAIRYDFNPAQSVSVIFLGRTEDSRRVLGDQIAAFQAEIDRDPGLAACGLDFAPDYGDPAVIAAFHDRLRGVLGILSPFLSQFAELCSFLEIKSLVDAGCGDFSWMSQVSGGFSLYIGLDTDGARITDLDYRFGGYRGHFFACRDVAIHPLPAADAILCRDLFSGHSVETVQAMLANVKASGSRYLMASTVPGGPAPLDLSAPPFGMPLPLIQFADERAPGWLLGVWLL